MSSDMGKEEGDLRSGRRYRTIDPRDIDELRCCEFLFEIGRLSSEGIREMRAVVASDLEVERGKEGMEGVAGLRGEDGKLRERVGGEGFGGVGVEEVDGVRAAAGGSGDWRTSLSAIKGTLKSTSS